MANDKSKCVGCVDDFYNDKNPLGVKQCWSLDQAQLVTRYRIGTWTKPTEPRAFTEVEVYDCRREKGASLYHRLPSCATDVVHGDDGDDTSKRFAMLEPYDRDEGRR